MINNNEYVRGWNDALIKGFKIGISKFSLENKLLILNGLKIKNEDNECKGCIHRYDGGWCIRCCRNKKDCYEGEEE